MSDSQEIIEACMDVLKTIKIHPAKTKPELPFITGYQIWEKLKQRQHPICQSLIDKCGGDLVGEGHGEGAGDGPVRRIGQTLVRCSDIETQYIDTKYLSIAGNGLTGSDCGLFRLNK